jgi:hypothetical protein
MRNWMTLAVVFALVLGGFPHAFCGCGCAGGNAQAQVGDKPVVPACPHCCGGDSAPTKDPPQPCKCAACHAVKAVVADSYTSAPSSDSVWRAAIEPAGLATAPLASLASSQDSRTGPLSASLQSGCALPVLLGHLLL